MSDLNDRLVPYVSRAQRHKKSAVAARNKALEKRASGELREAESAEILAAEEFKKAHAAVSEAFEEIESRGKFNPSISGPLDQATKEQAFSLADCWGVRGGIFREQGEIESSIAAYETGYRLESNASYEINSTYNTVNRLVVRLLIDPDLLKSDSFATAGGDQEGIPQLLRAASAAIGEKWKVMTDPVWALADMVLIKALLHSPDLEEWETKLKDHASERFPFDSLLGLISTLAKSDIPAAHALKELAKRLEGHVAEKWPPKKAVNPS